MNVHPLNDLHDGDTEMLPIEAVVDQVAGSLRQLREQWEYCEDVDIDMESAFEHQSSVHQSSQPLRLLIIDTNILIGHLNLIEWLGELLIAARKLRKGSDYRCGLLIPRMVRLELDKHKMPHNRHRMITALLEPPPANSSRLRQTLIQSLGGSKLASGSSCDVRQSIQISLLEASDQAIKWMARLFRSIPSDRSIIKFQTKTEVVDPNLMTSPNSMGIKVSPDMHILDCASYFKLQVEPQGGGVMLLTNDRALSLEAEVEGIPTLRVQLALSPQSLLHSFDPILAHEIDLLIAEVSFKNMLTADWYRKISNGNSKLYPHQTSTGELLTPVNQSRYARESKSFSKNDKTLSTNHSSSLIEQTFDTQDNIDELTIAMPIQIDEEMSIADCELIPIFPPLLYQYMLIPSPLSTPKLIYFHHHIEQAVGALLRPRLFKFLFHSVPHEDLASLFHKVALVFERRRIDSQIHNAQDPNQWTAVDCLILIDELWNESTRELFQPDNQVLFQSAHQSLNMHKSGQNKTLDSRWAPSSQFETEVQEQQTFPYSNRLGRTRKSIQVLIHQLQPYFRIESPQDNPVACSFLFWDGLIEDIHKVIYYGKFYETLSGLEIETKDLTLQKIIQNWKNEACCLCNEST